MKFIDWIEIDLKSYSVYSEDDSIIVHKYSNDGKVKEAVKKYTKTEFRIEFINQLPINIEDLSDKIKALLSG